MSRWVADLFCCAGGATRGLQLAGFKVLGVDKYAHPDYCGDDFEEADAPSWLAKNARRVDRLFVLAGTSPPCQYDNPLTMGTNGANGWGSEHTQEIPRLRESFGMLTTIPWYIEQPNGRRGRIRKDLMLCMDMFAAWEPPWIQRHRKFEFERMSVPQPVHRKHQGRVRGMRHHVTYDGPYVAVYGDGGGKAKLWEAQHALDIDWTSDMWALKEAIPPAYTEYIGRHL